jgi:hypothetical protein
MKTNDELKDQVIANLSIENQVLKNKIEILKKDNENYGRYWLESRDKVKKLEAELNNLKGIEVVTETETK